MLLNIYFFDVVYFVFALYGYEVVLKMDFDSFNLFYNSKSFPIAIKGVRLDVHSCKILGRKPKYATIEASYLVLLLTL